MKIDICDIDKLIEVNKIGDGIEIPEITSPGLLSHSSTWDPNGIMSYELFGVSKSDRRSTFGYIELGQPFIHPHIYGNILKRGGFQPIVNAISGLQRYKIVDGKMVPDEDGWMGLRELYKHWDQINFSTFSSTNKRNINLLQGTPKEKAFVVKWLVVPPLYRDMTLAGTIDKSDHSVPVNDMYTALIRNIDGLRMGDVLLNSRKFRTEVRIQELLLEICVYFKERISEKSGLIRKYLLGKSVDYGVRSVISAPLYNKETIGENMVDMEHTALPLAQACSIFMPFVEAWLKGFFTREIINDPSLITFYDIDSGKEVTAVMKEPEIQFSEKNIKKRINDYMFNPDNRFLPITIRATLPESTKQKEVVINAHLILKGKQILPNNIQENLSRVMTITDLLYLACHDITKNRHAMITRYPVGTDKGLFFNKIRIQSTREHINLIFNGQEYPFYPKIDLDMPKHMVGIQFVDTTVFSNSFLDGLGKRPGHCRV